MAIKKDKEKEEKKKNKINILLLVKVIVPVIILCSLFSTVISNYARVKQNNRQVEEVSLSIVELENENDEMIELMKDENLYDYIERIAREKYNYCSPDERVFYSVN